MCATAPIRRVTSVCLQVSSAKFARVAIRRNFFRYRRTNADMMSHTATPGIGFLGTCVWSVVPWTIGKNSEDYVAEYESARRSVRCEQEMLFLVVAFLQSRSLKWEMLIIHGKSTAPPSGTIICVLRCSIDIRVRRQTHFPPIYAPAY